MAPLRLDTVLKLNDGRTIPQLGLGVYQSRGRACVAGCAEALRLGYRHIDTAQLYANEAEVGQAVRDEAHAKRDDVFVTTKVGPPFTLFVKRDQLTRPADLGQQPRLRRGAALPRQEPGRLGPRLL